MVLIPLTKLKGERIWLNPDLIETVEATPDTIIALTTGRRMVVLESPESIRDRIVTFKRMLAAKSPVRNVGEGEADS